MPLIARRTIELYATRHTARTSRAGNGRGLERHENEAPVEGDAANESILTTSWSGWDDLVIVDQRNSSSAELPVGSFLGLVEHRYGESRFPNTGVMVLRGGETAAEFLDQTWTLERYVDHEWWENAAVCELLGYALDPPRPLHPTPWLEQTTFISPRWNWIPNARVRRARVRHFPGYSVRTRRLMMLAALARGAACASADPTDRATSRASSAA